MASTSEEPLSIFDQDFRADLAYFIQHDRRVALKVMKLVEAVMRDLFEGVGKPEPLRYMGAAVWSRRVSREHRLVYLVEDDCITFMQARYHY